MKKKYTLLVLVMICLTFFANTGLAIMQIDINGPGQNTVNLAMAAPLTSTNQRATALGAKLDAAIKDNLSFLPFMRMTPDAAILGGTVLAGYQSAQIDFRRFQIAGADILITAGWQGNDNQGSTVELRAFETFSGNFVFGNAYSGVTDAELYKVADRFCSDLIKALTGKGDFFLSHIAYIKKSAPKQSDVWISKPTGREAKKITSIPGTALSPSWSPDGRYIVFSHLDDSSHSLGVWDRISNNVQKIRFKGNTVIGPCFMPDNKVAVSLTTTGYPDIFLLNYKFERERGLEESPAINVSPTFDSTGTRMAFTSNRLGGPQIFIKELNTGQVTRVSQNGGYNTEPNLSLDGTLVVFTRLTDQGQRIFVQDMITGMERQLSFGPGDDEQPAFAPDSYFIIFTSSRSGTKQLYLTTRHGGDPKLVPTGGGEVSFARWGRIPDPLDQNTAKN